MNEQNYTLLEKWVNHQYVKAMQMINAEKNDKSPAPEILETVCDKTLEIEEFDYLLGTFGRHQQEKAKNIVNKESIILQIYNKGLSYVSEGVDYVLDNFSIGKVVSIVTASWLSHNFIYHAEKIEANIAYKPNDFIPQVIIDTIMQHVNINFINPSYDPTFYNSAFYRSVLEGLSIGWLINSALANIADGSRYALTRIININIAVAFESHEMAHIIMEKGAKVAPHVFEKMIQLTKDIPEFYDVVKLALEKKLVKSEPSGYYDYINFAVDNKQLEIVEALINAGFKVHSPTFEKMIRLVKDDSEYLNLNKLALEKGVVEAESGIYNYINHAVDYRQYEIVEALINAGFKVHSPTFEKMIRLVRDDSEYLNLNKLALEKGVVEAESGIYNYINHAIDYRQYEIVEALINAGFKVHSPTFEKMIKFAAGMFPKYLKLSKLALEKGVVEVESGIYNYINYAIDYRQYEIVEALINVGFTVRLVTFEKMIKSAEGGDSKLLELSKLALEKGVVEANSRWYDHYVFAIDDAQYQYTMLELLINAEFKIQPFTFKKMMELAEFDFKFLELSKLAIEKKIVKGSPDEKYNGIDVAISNKQYEIAEAFINAKFKIFPATFEKMMKFAESDFEFLKLSKLAVEKGVIEVDAWKYDHINFAIDHQLYEIAESLINAGFSVYFTVVEKIIGLSVDNSELYNLVKLATDTQIFVRSLSSYRASYLARSGLSSIDEYDIISHISYKQYKDLVKLAAGYGQTKISQILLDRMSHDFPDQSEEIQHLFVVSNSETTYCAFDENDMLLVGHHQCPDDDHIDVS